MESRKIVIFSANGKSNAPIHTTAEKLGDLQADFSRLNISLNNMSVVVGETTTELLGQDSILPEGPITLFLMQKKSKAGAGAASYDRKGLYETIKSYIAADGDKAKKHFADDGKNYTQLSSQKLNELVVSYGKKGSKKTTEVAIPNTKSNVANIVKSDIKAIMKALKPAYVLILQEEIL